jgi:hypothetical protein
MKQSLLGYVNSNVHPFHTEKNHFNLTIDVPTFADYYQEL